MDDTEERNRAWAEWLNATMAQRGMTSSAVVKASGTKENGRPNIDGARMTAWRGSGKKPPERPGYDMALLLARILGVSPLELLRAAGYHVDGEASEGDPPERSHLTVEVANEHEKRMAEAFIAAMRAAEPE